MATAAAIKRNCRKVVCVGRNYADHIKELNNQRPKQPFFFLKPPSSILLPSDRKPVLRPKGVDLHYEVELGFVVGKTLRDLSPDDVSGADDAISTYLVTIDMTARNVQNEAKKKGLPWDIAKGFDTFLPISNPVPKSLFPTPPKGSSDQHLPSHNPYAAQLHLEVDGQVRQDDSAELMLFRIPRLLSDISSVMELEEGDIVLTGTPKGIGEVKVGERMTAGLRLEGKEIEEGRIDVMVEEKGGIYAYQET